MDEDTEYYNNFHEIFNINPEIHKVNINTINVDNYTMTILVALYKLFGFVFKFRNNNPVLLHKFSKSDEGYINANIQKFIRDISLSKIYSNYIDILYKKQYLTNTLSGNNVNDMHTKYPDYLLEITQFTEENGIVITPDLNFIINRP